MKYLGKMTIIASHPFVFFTMIPFMFWRLHHASCVLVLYTVDQIYHLASPASPPNYMYNPIKVTQKWIHKLDHNGFRHGNLFWWIMCIKWNSHFLEEVCSCKVVSGKLRKDLWKRSAGNWIQKMCFLLSGVYKRWNYCRD